MKTRITRTLMSAALAMTAFSVSHTALAEVRNDKRHRAY